jgi:hypothetical protein
MLSRASSGSRRRRWRPGGSSSSPAARLKSRPADDKVFPPTYAGGQYAIESRVDGEGVVKDVVLLTLPMIAVTFSRVQQPKGLAPQSWA